MLPGSRGRPAYHHLDALRFVAFDLVLRAVALPCALIANHHLFQHVGGGHAWEIGSTGRRAQRQRQSNQIVMRIADHRLIEIPNLHMHVTVRRSQRAQVASMAVPANPHRRPLGHRARAVFLQPAIKLHGAATHVGMSGTRHLQLSSRSESGGASSRRNGVVLITEHMGSSQPAIHTPSSLTEPRPCSFLNASSRQLRSHQRPLPPSQRSS